MQKAKELIFIILFAWMFGYSWYWIITAKDWKDVAWALFLLLGSLVMVSTHLSALYSLIRKKRQWNKSAGELWKTN